MGGPFGGMQGPFLAQDKPAPLIIMPLDREGRENQDYGGAIELQFWPQTIETSRTANWQSKDIPGAPIPLRQWVSGGPHTMSFTVTFSRDMRGTIGSDVKEDKFNVDIEAAIKKLEMFMMPSPLTIGTSVVSSAPPTLWVYAHNVYLGSNFNGLDSVMGNPMSGVTDVGEGNGIYVDLDSVNVSRMNWFSSGQTKYVNLPLSFSETMQIGGQILPYSALDFKSIADRYTRKPS